MWLKILICLASASRTPNTKGNGISKAGHSWEYPSSPICRLSLSLEKLSRQPEMQQVSLRSGQRVPQKVAQTVTVVQPGCHQEQRIWWFKENLGIAYPLHPAALFSHTKETVAWILFPPKQKKYPPAPTVQPQKQT